MVNFRRRMIMSLNKASRLPSAYQEVEFIGSTGSQYIDTGFKPNQDTSVEIIASWNPTDNTELLLPEEVGGDKGL